jgi:hypothetical protein
MAAALTLVGPLLAGLAVGVVVVVLVSVGLAGAVATALFAVGGAGGVVAFVVSAGLAAGTSALLAVPLSGALAPGVAATTGAATAGAAAGGVTAAAAPGAAAAAAAAAATAAAAADVASAGVGVTGVGTTGAGIAAAAAEEASSVELPLFLQASSAPITSTAHNVTDRRDPIHNLRVAASVLRPIARHPARKSCRAATASVDSTLVKQPTAVESNRGGYVARRNAG